MNLAKYFCAGQQEYTRHYALAMPLYTHFTSPIRRYADLVVHRQVFKELKVSTLVIQVKNSDSESKFLKEKVPLRRYRKCDIWSENLTLENQVSPRVRSYSQKNNKIFHLKNFET